jgi:hypothetical protein
VRLELPDGFADQPVFNDRVMGNGQDGKVLRYATFGERKGNQDYGLFVLNQTNDDLILGMQVGLHGRWLPGKRIGAFLPLLWAVPKADLVAAYSEAKAISKSKR